MTEKLRSEIDKFMEAYNEKIFELLSHFQEIFDVVERIVKEVDDETYLEIINDEEVPKETKDLFKYYREIRRN